jgi:nucleotide-binding universal stress UspA family protein
MFKKIVVGYDGSDQAKDALALARLLASAGTSLVAASIYKFEDVYGKGSSGDAGFESALREEAEGLLGEVGEGVEKRTHGRGSPAHGLQEVAESEGADLMVVGSTHHGAVGRTFVGSTSERLLHGSPCPVAVAPKGFASVESAEIHVVAAAYQGVEEARRALDLAKGIAMESGATLRVISVVEPPETATPVYANDYHRDEYSQHLRQSVEDELADVVANAPGELHTQASVITGDPAAILAKKAEGVDLMVMGSRGYGAVKGVLLGSVSAKLIRSASCPLVVVPRTSATPESQGEQGEVRISTDALA